MIYLHILDQSEVRLWGLTQAQRLQRQLQSITDYATWPGAAAAAPTEGSVLVVRADYLFEARTLEGLLQLDRRLLRCADNAGLAAAHVGVGDWELAVAALESQEPGSLQVIAIADLNAFDGFLRKSQAPLLAKVELSNVQQLESTLYGNSYKGITDLVTKWWWPRPARVVVGWCARARISPNAVTLFGLLLMLGACWLFWEGQYLLGLVCGWVMTFLDTVDGKLARVTIQSSKLGHVLDHGMDILHPPFWYVIWGLSLPGDQAVWCYLVAAAYVAGRLIEGAFHALGDCSMFAWRPFDAYFRLITARRNPALILLTLAVFAGRPDWGFYAVVIWSVLSSAIMLVRLGFAASVRFTEGPLQSWLADSDKAKSEQAAAFALFSGTRGAYTQVGGGVPVIAAGSADTPGVRDSERG